MSKSKRLGHKQRPKTPLHKRNKVKLKDDRLESSRSHIQGTIIEEDEPTGDTSSWGKGGLLKNLSNQSEVSKDIALLSRALKQRWDIKKKDIIQKRLMKVLEKEEVTVPTKEGTMTLEEPADRNAVAAARVLVQMEGQDIERDQFNVKQGNPQSGTTVNVFGTPQPGPSRILQLAQSLGAREIVIDGQAVESNPTPDSVGESKEA